MSQATKLVFLVGSLFAKTETVRGALLPKMKQVPLLVSSKCTTLFYLHL